MGIQGSKTKNNIKSKNYSTSKNTEGARKNDIDWLVFCTKAKYTVQWVEEYIKKDVCRLNSKPAFTTSTQIVQLDYHLRPVSDHVLINRVMKDNGR